MVHDGCIGSEAQYAATCPTTFHGLFTRGAHAVVVALTQAVTTTMIDVLQAAQLHVAPLRENNMVLLNIDCTAGHLHSQEAHVLIHC